MKLALRLIRLATGAADWICETSVSENGEAPLLTVASIAPSGERARPNGFGACTLTSTPAGVTRRPFGRTAASRPLMVVCAAAGRLPAGAEKRRKSESRRRSARIASEPAVSTPTRTTDEAATDRCRHVFCMVAFLSKEVEPCGRVVVCLSEPAPVESDIER